MKEKTKKEIKISVIIVFTAIVLILIFPRIMYVDSSITCGKIMDRYSIRGTKYFEFNFVVNDKLTHGSISQSFIKKNISFDSIKKIKCLKIEYSNYSSFFSRVVDDRVVIE